MVGERLMTQKTLEGLRDRKAQLEEEIRRMGAEGSGHQRSSLHDDASAENTLNLARGSLQKIGDLSEARIITPRKDTKDIDCGNKVRLEFEDGEEIIYLLGSDDTIHRKDLGTVTSTDSPLGGAIRGKKVGDTVEIRLKPGQTIKVKVKDVLPGDF